jgi:hypothetical protein
MFLAIHRSVIFAFITINMKFVCFFVCLLLRAAAFVYLKSTVYKRRDVMCKDALTAEYAHCSLYRFVINILFQILPSLKTVYPKSCLDCGVNQC